MTTLEELRKYRIELDNINILNSDSRGIALFDLILSFIGAYIIDYIFNLSYFLPCKNKKEVYYLLVIPFGILIHHIIAHLRSFPTLIPEEITFLNKKIFSLELNIYKIVIVTLLYMIYLKC